MWLSKGTLPLRRKCNLSYGVILFCIVLYCIRVTLYCVTVYCFRAILYCNVMLKGYCIVVQDYSLALVSVGIPSGNHALGTLDAPVPIPFNIANI